MNESLEPPVISRSVPLWTNPASNRAFRFSPIVVIGAAVAVMVLAAILFLFDPRQFAFYPRCLLHTVTGLHCPGCGALRGMHELLHGHLSAAMRMNALLFLGLPVAGCVYLYQRVRNQDGAAANVLKSPLLGWWTLAAVVLFWALRNVPVYPFTLLAP